ncbi:MAG: transporter substrate-binding domain-containing protein [Clostridia bacterium]|nr:transporter substrate-binding domain-containing protein [Clostridia bacterium]
MKKARVTVFLVSIILMLQATSILAADDYVYKTATEYDYPPFSVTGSGEADGFSVELLKAVAEEVGITLSFKIDEWSVIKEELKNGQLDVLPLVGYTAERDQYYDFTVPYIVMYGNIFVRTDNTTIQSEDDLYGKQLIVMKGDNAAEYAERMNFTTDLIETATYQEAFELLSSGQYDAVLAQGLVGEKLISDLNIKNVHSVTQLDHDGVTRIKTRLSGFEQKFCFAVKDGDKELLSKLNEGLAIVSVNGTYNRLYEKWFPFIIDNTPSLGEVLTYAGLILIPVVILLLIGFILYSKKEVKNKTSQLQKANQELLSLEAHLRNQQKLGAIGTLASGVAHEINNPINGIMNYSQLILDENSNNSRLNEYANEILNESQRVTYIVKNLLNFSRQDKITDHEGDVAETLQKTLSLINAVIRHDQIELIMEIEENLPTLSCNCQELQQVLMNLITNAKDALNEKYPDADKNKIIRLTCRKFHENSISYIRVIVEDHGNGIKKEVQDKIFEPFFTTKGRDSGTGLGLYISYGIVKDHKGRLTFETEEGQYTRFILDLPI